MMRIALRCLLHDRAKLATAISGVALSATLATVQLGLHAGFREACSAMIRHAGGDLWVMARDTRVFDDALVMPSGTRALVAEHPCVRRVRSLAITRSQLQTAGSPRVWTFMVGLERDEDRLLPWSLAAGLPADLQAPLRVSIDRFDLRRFELAEDAIGAPIMIDGQPGTVAAITQGIKTFTMAPFVFSSIDTVRALANWTDDQSTYHVVDLRDRACATDVLRWVERRPNLEVRTSEQFRAGSEEFWMSGSGAGPVLTFGTLLGLLVGAAIMAQTLFALTRDHVRELSTLKALGASRRELISFVLWQAGALALAGASIGLAAACALRVLARLGGLNVVLSPPVLALSVCAVALVCALSSLLSVRAVLGLDPASVFR